MTISKDILFEIVAKKQQSQKNLILHYFYAIFIQLINESKQQ